MEITVLDFTGFQLGDILIIKEFCVAYVNETSIHVEDPMVISTKSSPISPELLLDSRNFLNFYKKYRMRFGGPSSHTAADLASKVQSLLRGNVYVRDASDADFLTRYFNLKFNPFKLLTDLNFNPKEEILETRCRNHRERNCYCAGDNVRCMALWLKARLAELSNSKTNLAVIDFEISEFGINQVRVCCFDNRGIVVYNKPIAPVTVYDSSNVTDAYNIRYQAIRGVAWNVHDLKIAGIKSILNKILRENSIEFIFVKSAGHKNFIHAVIGSSFRVVALDDYDYAERADESCEEAVRNMVRWVLQQKFYEG